MLQFLPFYGVQGLFYTGKAPHTPLRASRWYSAQSHPAEAPCPQHTPSLPLKHLPVHVGLALLSQYPFMPWHEILRVPMHLSLQNASFPLPKLKAAG